MHVDNQLMSMQRKKMLSEKDKEQIHIVSAKYLPIHDDDAFSIELGCSPFGTICIYVDIVDCFQLQNHW